MFDIAAWQFDKNGHAYETVSGEVVQGLPALAQRVFMSLLQERDSTRYSFGRQSMGCDFMTALRNGTMRSEMDVSAHFFLARHLIFAELRAAELGSDPPEARLKELQLKGIRLQPGVMRLQLRIASHADELTTWLPIAIPK